MTNVEEFMQGLMKCDRLPGHPKLSARVCGANFQRATFWEEETKRRKASETNHHKVVTSNDRSGCVGCPIGKKHAKEFDIPKGNLRDLRVKPPRPFD